MDKKGGVVGKPTLTSSVLNTIKHAIGFEPDYTIFDSDLRMHINSALMILDQLGAVKRASIQDSSDTWDDVLIPGIEIDSAQTYVFIRVKRLFDPPQTAALTSAYAEEIKMLETRIRIQAERKPDGENKL